MEPGMDRTEQVDLGDVTLSVGVAGEGPVVLAAHGFPDDASTFRAQVPALVRAGYPSSSGSRAPGTSSSGRGRRRSTRR